MANRLSSNAYSQQSGDLDSQKTRNLVCQIFGIDQCGETFVWLLIIKEVKPRGVAPGLTGCHGP